MDSCTSVTAVVGGGADNSGDDTCTTSTSFWAICEDCSEGIIGGPGCKSWPGVTREGVFPSFITELDALIMDVGGSEILLKGIIGSGTVLGMSETDGATAILSTAVVNGEANGNLLGRVWVETLSGIKFVESETIAEDRDGRVEVCKFNGGNKGGGFSKSAEAEVLDAFMAGYCTYCNMEGGIDKLGGGRSKACCGAWTPFEGP